MKLDDQPPSSAQVNTQFPSLPAAGAKPPYRCWLGKAWACHGCRHRSAAASGPLE